MKKVNLLMTLTLLSVISVFGQTKWTFDKAHTSILFSIDHMVISEVVGKFEKFDGTVETKSDKDFTDAKIKLTIDVKSINTDNEERDKHLKSPDFFDAEKYPTIKFESTSMKKLNGNFYLLKGKLTMHGITKEVELEVKYNGTVKDPWGNIKAGFKVVGTINRKDFGIVYNSTLESGGLLIGEEERINCNVELIKL